MIEAIIVMFILAFLMLFIIAIYVYTSLAYYSLAKKTKTPDKWLAFIPFFNYILIARMAKMSPWPILFVIPFIFSFLFILISPVLFIIFMIFGILILIPLVVFWYIWHWKIYERVGKPGWWIIFTIIPYVGGILYLIFLGIAAWSKN